MASMIGMFTLVWLSTSKISPTCGVSFLGLFLASGKGRGGVHLAMSFDDKGSSSSSGSSCATFGGESLVGVLERSGSKVVGVGNSFEISGS